MGLVQQPFLAYDVGVVAAPEHPVAVGTVGLDQLANQVWHLGPGATELAGETSAVLRRLRVPEKRQRIFQSDAAALGETRRGMGLAIAVGLHGARRPAQRPAGAASRRLELTDRGSWSTWALAGDQQISAAAELVRFVGTPRATQAMLRGEAAGVGRFRPAVHVTLWS